MPRILLRSQAEAEIDEIAKYIAARNLEAGKRFYDACENAFETLAEHPRIGAMRRVRTAKLKGLRSWPINGYDNYLIFYLPLAERGIDVLHVLHGARDLKPIIDHG